MWPFRRREAEKPNELVGEYAVSWLKVNQVRERLRSSRNSKPEIWVAGDFTDLPTFEGVGALGIPIDRRFSSVAAMLQAALKIMNVRAGSRKYEDEPLPTPVLMLMSEPSFYASQAETRFRLVVEHPEATGFEVVVVCSWLRPID